VSEDKKEPELTPEQEALVGNFVHQLNAESGEVVIMVNTPVGPVRITDEDNAEIRAAVVRKTVRMIEEEPQRLSTKIFFDVAGLGMGALILSGVAYVVHAVARAIAG
jgi:hypothetical protein